MERTGSMANTCDGNPGRVLKRHIPGQMLFGDEV
jgi:hypothetical protein